MMNVIGNAITPAVMITSLNDSPKMFSVNGSSITVNNLPAVASATTSAVIKSDAHTTYNFWGLDSWMTLLICRRLNGDPTVGRQG